MTYKTRRRLALLILLVGLPVYIVVVITVLGLLGRPPLWVEFAVYVAFGVLWAVPFRFIFKGVGQADPDAGDDAPK